MIVSDEIPTPDRNSADFRFSKLLGMLAEDTDVHYCVLGEQPQRERIGAAAVERYAQSLTKLGITLIRSSLKSALKATRYDAVIFEWYFPARDLLVEVRTWQPEARVIVDSVDVVFNRLEAKARVTDSNADRAKAIEGKSAELSVYEMTDLVITVTDADAAILQRENPALKTFTIPNIHPLQDPIPAPARDNKNLVFIGSYARPGGETNIDAMLYFCRDILPLIAAAEPDVRLKIIGGPPTPEITGLASEHVQVLGFVPDTKPFLEASAISIAPLRFGGGMKGKIGEAMSLGLPVVTTSTGIEGFGLEPDKHVLMGDTPRAFADAVIGVLRDRSHLERVRMAGWQFIRDNYSDVAVRMRVRELLRQLHSYPVKRAGMAPVFLRKARDAWERRVAWRFK